MNNNLSASPRPVPELLSAPRLLETLWPDEKSRPSLRWLREQQRRRTIPTIKWGKRTFFNPAEVAAAIERLTLKGKTASTKVKSVTDATTTNQGGSRA